MTLPPALAALFDSQEHPVNPSVLSRFLAGFPEPRPVAEGMVEFAREYVRLVRPGDSPDRFLADTFLPGHLSLLTNIPGFPLLRFPPGSGIFPLAARTIPWILERQVLAAFPDLPAVLARHYPAMSAARSPAGTGNGFLHLIREIGYEDVLTGVMTANTGVYHLRLAVAPGHLVLKRTDMGVEKLIAGLLETRLGLPAVRIVWTGPVFSVMNPVAGRSLRDLSGNPLTEPRRRCWSPAEIRPVARVLGEEAALAWYLHLDSRHSGNILAAAPEDLPRSGFVRIDFGQSLLDSRQPVLEAFMPLWHLRRFFSTGGNEGYEDPGICSEIGGGFCHLAERIRRNRKRIGVDLESAIGLELPEMVAETGTPAVAAADVERVRRAMGERQSPAEVFNRIYDQFYRNHWQVSGWQEYHAPRDRSFEWGGEDYSDLLPDRHWGPDEDTPSLEDG